jgi:hypothetical protein
VLGGATGALTTLLQARKSLEAQYGIDLRKSRIDTYRQLWSSLQPLAYYGPRSALREVGLRDLSRAMQSWYFGRGGLFMSAQTRTAYFRLHALLEEGASTAADDGRIDARVAEAVKSQASKLRDAMANDVATRRPPASVTAAAFGAGSGSSANGARRASSQSAPNGRRTRSPRRWTPKSD